MDKYLLFVCLFFNKERAILCCLGFIEQAKRHFWTSHYIKYHIPPSIIICSRYYWSFTSGWAVTWINCDGNKKTMIHFSYKEHWILRGTERFVFVSLNRGRGRWTMKGGGNKVTMRQSHWQCQGNTKSQSESWAEINKMSRSQKYHFCCIRHSELATPIKTSVTRHKTLRSLDLTKYHMLMFPSYQNKMFVCVM